MSNAVVTGVQPVENEHNVADAKQVRGPISRLILDASVRKGLQPTPDQLGHSIPVGCRDKSFIYHLPELNLQCGVIEFILRTSFCPIAVSCPPTRV